MGMGRRGLQSKISNRKITMTKYYAYIISSFGRTYLTAGFFDSIEDAKRRVEEEKMSILLNMEDREIATLYIYEQGTNKRVYTEEL